MMSFCLLLLTIFGTDNTDAETAVINLGANNFTEFRQMNSPFMMLFSVDWCTNCVNMWPEYELAAQELLREDPPIKLTKVNGMTENSLAEQFSVSTYPTIIVMDGELGHRYKGAYRAKDMIEHMKKLTSAGYEIVSSTDDISWKRTVDDTVLLALCSSFSHPRMYKFRRTLNVTPGKFRPMASNSQTLRRHFGSADREFAVFLLKPLRFSIPSEKTEVDVTQLFLNDTQNEVKLGEQLAREQLPLVSIYGRDRDEMYRANDDRLLCVIPYSLSAYKKQNEVLNKLTEKLIEPMITEFADRIHWIIVDDLMHTRFLDRFDDPEHTGEMSAVATEAGRLNTTRLPKPSQEVDWGDPTANTCSASMSWMR
ncbi:unnamed protein product [Dicrocoelium dendriticum]|nr:unnamed protein product [Dicrocoelium dendriticum]